MTNFVSRSRNRGQLDRRIFDRVAAAEACEYVQFLALWCRYSDDPLASLHERVKEFRGAIVTNLGRGLARPERRQIEPPTRERGMFGRTDQMALEGMGQAGERRRLQPSARRFRSPRPSRPVKPRVKGTVALVPPAADAVRTPIVAAGGIADGRGGAAALALGAAAVQIGTAFLASDESNAHPEAQGRAACRGARRRRVVVKERRLDPQRRARRPLRATGAILNVRGGMAERLMAAVLKTAVVERLPWVRIPLPPPISRCEIGPEGVGF